jgi:hypothetical protein
MKSILFAAISAAFLLISCGRSTKPSNKIMSQEIDANGFQPDPRGSAYDPVPVSDTFYFLEPTWKQANHFAAKRGDFVVWQILGVILLLAAAGAIYCQAADVSWFPRISVNMFAVLLGALLVGGFMSCKWQSAEIRWGNSVKVNKKYYEMIMAEDGSTKRVWDSLESNCKIIGGPYGCYQ